MGSNLVFEVIWNPEPIAVEEKIASKQSLIFEMPLGVLVSGGGGGEGGGGGGSYDFSVQELNLEDYTSLSQSTVQITPDVSNTILDSAVNGVVVPNQEPPSISAYFKGDSGRFAITVNTTNQVYVLLESVSVEPTTKKTQADLQAETKSLLILIMYSKGSLVVQAGDLFNTAPDLDLTIFDPLPEETIEIEYLDVNTLRFYNKGFLIGTYQQPTTIGQYFHTITDVNMPNGDRFQYNLTQLKQKTYVLPETAKDGDIYHLNSAGILLNKELRVDDYIQIYDNKQNFILIRVPEDVPEIPTTEATKIPLKINVYGSASIQMIAWWDVELKALFICGSIYVSAEVWRIEIELIPEINITNYTSFYPLAVSSIGGYSPFRLQVDGTNTSEGITNLVLNSVDVMTLGLSYHLGASVVLTND